MARAKGGGGGYNRLAATASFGGGGGRDILGRLVKALYALVLIFALLLAAITINGFKVVDDPVTPVSILDRLSFVMGVHDKQAVTVLDIDAWSTTVYTFVFHRKLNDNSFHLAEQKKERLIPGLFGSGSSSTESGATSATNENGGGADDVISDSEAAAIDAAIDARIRAVLETAEHQQPSSTSGFFRLQSANDYNRKTPLVAKLSDRVTNNKVIQKSELANVMRKFLSHLDACDTFEYNAESGIGTIDDVTDVRALQWFAVNLMTQKLQVRGGGDWKLRETAVLFDVTERDLNLTLAMPASHSGTRDGDALKTRLHVLAQNVVATRKMTAFGHPLQLVTLTFKGLGLNAARRYAFTQPGTFNVSGGSTVNDDAAENSDIDDEVIATTKADILQNTRQEAKVYSVLTSCVNPITDTYWQWRNEVFHIRGLGLEKGDHEMVKERNGPFQGKRHNRPVANYNYCSGVMSKYVAKHLQGAGVKGQLESLLKGRAVFMEGLLKEKCVERGLSLPNKGGDVPSKLLMESLRNACRIPNTEQPLACVDLTFLTTLLDQVVGGLKTASGGGMTLHSSKMIKGFTAEWPLGAAFYVYETGL